MTQAGKIPVSDKIRPRPVWARSLRRTLLNTERLSPPSEAEQRDALSILTDCRGAVDPLSALEVEAFRVFDEAGR